jgi:hypothetical protein
MIGDGARRWAIQLVEKLAIAEYDPLTVNTYP